MPPQEQQQTQDQKSEQTSKMPDNEGYYRFGRRTLLYLLLRDCLLAIIFFVGEVMLVAAAAGGNNLPPFSEFVSANGTFEIIVKELETIVPFFIIIAGLIGLITAYTAYRSFRYKIENNSLSLVSGIIGRRKVSLPFSQIQNVDLEQHLAHRIFGLVNVVIMTRGHSDPKHAHIEDNEVIIPSISMEEGQRMHSFLLDHLNASNAGGMQYSP
jgi:uncharacterized membrane protein YdbT with pleckstrin-like domain